MDILAKNHDVHVAVLIQTGLPSLPNAQMTPHKQYGDTLRVRGYRSHWVSLFSSVKLNAGYEGPIEIGLCDKGVKFKFRVDYPLKICIKSHCWAISLDEC